MRKVYLLLLGAALPLLLAATGGGFPSRPTFQTVTATATLGTPPLTSNATIIGSGIVGGKIKLISSSGAANGKVSELTSSGTQFILRTVDDADSATSNILAATRSGVSVTDVSLGNAVSNPTYNFLGTGTAAFGGNVTAGGASVCRADGTNCPGAGVAISCTTACNVSTLAAGQAAMIRAGSTVSVTSNTTQANDADLQFTNLPAGTYTLWGTIRWTGNGGGIKYDFLYSGTLTTADSPTLWFAAPGAGSCSITAALQNLQLFTTAVAGIYQCTGLVGVTVTNSFPAGMGTLVATGSGTLSLSWAQQSSNVTATQRKAGSFWVLTRIS